MYAVHINADQTNGPNQKTFVIKIYMANNFKPLVIILKF